MNKIDVSPINLRRHSLVWLSESAWQRILGNSESEIRDQLRCWQNSNWPGVVCRHDTTAAATNLSANDVASVGFSLITESGNKKRCAESVVRDEIVRARNPVSLQEALTAAPPLWQEQLDKLNDAFAKHEINVMVFGSLSLELLTRKKYLAAKSDIDLLVRINTEEQLMTALNLLDGYSKYLPLDGEIEFPRGRGVSWKEVLKAAQQPRNLVNNRVLVKALNSVGLAPWKDLLISLSGKAQPC